MRRQSRAISEEPSVHSGKTLIGESTSYTPGNYRGVIMQYKRAKSNNAMLNLEKNMEELTFKMN